MNEQVTFHLTATQLEEVQHKLGIVCEEPDLQTDYSLTQDDADILYRMFDRARPGVFTVTQVQAAVIAGELENAAEIACDNARDEGVKVYGFANAFRRVVQTIQAQTDGKPT